MAKKQIPQELLDKYNLTGDDMFNHQHYNIITRQGIDKIQAVENIFIEYTVEAATPEFAVIKAMASKGDQAKIETFGSAKYGEKEWIKFEKPNQYGKTGKWKENGNTGSWYIAEIAEKRAMSRAVLKLTGFYELGVFGEDESEDFKRGGNKNAPEKTEVPVAPSGLKIINETKKCELIGIAITKGKDALNVAVKGFELTEEIKKELMPHLKTE